MVGKVIDECHNLGRSMTDSETTPAAGAVDRLAGLVDAAEGDRRARRRLLDRASRVLAADAEAERRARSAVVQAEQRAKAVEAEAEARIKAAEARLRVQEKEREASRAEREAGRAEQAVIREVKAEVAAHRRARLASVRSLAGAAAPALLSMLVYSAAVASAVFGQVSVATGRYEWPMWRALLLAAFIELMALAMALTSNNLRLRGERALSPRILTWVFASFAAAVNIWGHFNDPLMAAGLGAASLGGITLWEIRSSARHRDTLRRVGQLAEPLPSLGFRFWIIQPVIAVTAYRIGVRTRVSLAAAPLIAQAEAERALRKASRDERRSHKHPKPLGANEPSSISAAPQPEAITAPSAPTASAMPAGSAEETSHTIPGVLSATGEFHVLTAPEHYERNGIGADTAVSGPALLSQATSAKRTPQRRTGIPDEARQWIGDCLETGTTPTGPEVGRKFRVDASTGRRWVRQVRDAQMIKVNTLG